MHFKLEQQQYKLIGEFYDNQGEDLMAIPKCLRFQKHKSVSMIFVVVNYTPVPIEFYNTCAFHLSQFVEFILCFENVDNIFLFFLILKQYVQTNPGSCKKYFHMENVEFLNKSISTFSTD